MHILSLFKKDVYKKWQLILNDFEIFLLLKQSLRTQVLLPIGGVIQRYA